MNTKEKKAAPDILSAKEVLSRYKREKRELEARLDFEEIMW